MLPYCGSVSLPVITIGHQQTLHRTWPASFPSRVVALHKCMISGDTEHPRPRKSSGLGSCLETLVRFRAAPFRLGNGRITRIGLKTLQRYDYSSLLNHS